MPTYRQFTPEEAVVILTLAQQDSADGLNDDAVQRLVGRSPVLEAIDNLHEMGMISEAIDSRGKPRKRHWRTTAAGEEQCAIQRRAIHQTLEDRIARTTGPDEADRLRELAAKLATRQAAAVTTSPTATSVEPRTQKAAKAKPTKKPKPQRREAQKPAEPAAT